MNAKIHALATKLNLPVGLTDGRVWAFIVLVSVGLLCWFGSRKSNKIIDARVDDAKTGANLSA